MSLDFVDRVAPRSGLRRPVVAIALAVAAMFAASAAPAQDQDVDAPTAAGEAERAYLDGDAFRTTFEGKTIHVTHNGEYFGSEQFFDGGRTLWWPRGQECVDGVWTYSEPYICFNYGYDAVACWTIFESADGLFAESIDGMVLEIASVTEEPLTCEPDLLS